MTAVDVDALDKLREAATELPWGHHPQDPAYIIGEVGGTEDEPEWLDVGDTGGRPPGYPGSAQADAALIVAAVNALPDLIAEVRRGRALWEAVEGLAAKYDQPAPSGPWPEGTRSLYGGGQVAYDLHAVLAAVDEP